MYVRPDLNDVFDNVPFAVHSLNRSGMVEYANNRWLSLFGYEWRDVAGKHITSFMPEEFADKAKKKFKELGETGIIDSLSMYIVRSTGEVIPIKISVFAAYDEDRKFLKSFAFLTPLEENHKHESAHAEFDYDTYIDMKNASLGQLLVSISHHWRQPLNALGLHIQNITDSMTGTEYQEKLKEFEKTCMSLILSMSDTIDAFKSFLLPKIENEFLIVKAVCDSVFIYQATLEEENISVFISCNCETGHGVFTPGQRPPCSGFCSKIIGNEANLKNVIMNLLSNSIKAINAAERQDGKIVISIYNYSDRKMIEVADNGIGIDDVLRDRVFEPYFTTKEVGQGQGIGLYLAKLIMEKSFNGSIRFTSGQGETRFILDF